MAQIFPSTADAILRISFLSATAGISAALLFLYNCNQPHYIIEDNMAPAQPVPFSHEHHVNGLGIDCRYCHTSVETSSFAGIPPTETCMTCHSQIWTDAPMLEPVRQSFFLDKPIEWNRVYDLPEFVYFDHSIHVSRGIGCAECHGEVDRMPLTRLNQPLTMKWCVDCHNNPYPNMRPVETVFEQEGWESLREKENLSLYEPKEHFNIDTHQLINCSTCHR